MRHPIFWQIQAVMGKHGKLPAFPPSLLPKGGRLVIDSSNFHRTWKRMQRMMVMSHYQPTTMQTMSLMLAD